MENNTLNEANPPDINPLMDKLLMKYNLQESPDNIYQKTKQGIRSNEGIVSYTAKDFFDGKITEKNASSALQKDLHVTPEVAQKIIIDVKDVLFPYFKILNEYITKYPPIEETEDNEPVSLPPTLKTNSTTGSMIKVPQRIKKNIKNLPEQKTQAKELKPSGPDSYREPI